MCRLEIIFRSLMLHGATQVVGNAKGCLPRVRNCARPTWAIDLGAILLPIERVPVQLLKSVTEAQSKAEARGDA